MMRFKRRLLTLLLLLTFACCLTGCGEKPNTTDTVKKYIEEELGFQEYDIFEKDGYWMVTLRKESELSFYVAEKTSNDLFGVRYYLVNDYYDVAAELMTEDFTGAPDLERTVSYDENNLLRSTVFKGSFTDRASLEDLLSQMQALTVYLVASEYPAKITVSLAFDHPLRVSVDSSLESLEVNVNWMDDGDYKVDCLTEVTDSVRAAFTQRLILMAKELHYEDILADFTKEEIKEAIADSSSCIGICYGDTNRDNYVYYENLCGTLYGKEISFPTLYEIMIREGYDVKGTAEKFSFTGIDGVSYELFFSTKDIRSMKLMNNGYEEETCSPGHLTAKMIAEKTGVNLYVWKMNYQPNANVFSGDGSLNRIDILRLNGENMTYNTVREGFFGNTTHEYKYIRYYEAEKTYYISVDIGWSTDEQSYPMVFAEYVQALDGTYEHSTTKAARGRRICKARWMMDGVTVETEAILDDTVTSFIVKKNGKKVDIDYMNSDSNLTNATFMIAIPVEKFADLMGLNYEIDQKEGAIDFWVK